LVLVPKEAAVLNARSEATLPKSLRIQRQHVLDSQQQIKQKHGNAAEQEHGNRVFSPAHFVFFIDTPVSR